MHGRITDVALNMINKWTLTFYGFHFPILLSVCHQVFSVIAVRAAWRMHPRPARSLHKASIYCCACPSLTFCVRACAAAGAPHGIHAVPAAAPQDTGAAVAGAHRHHELLHHQLRCAR